MLMVNENHKHNESYHDSNKQDVDDMHDYDKEYVSFCDELTSLLVSHFYECWIFGSGISSSEGVGSEILWVCRPWSENLYEHGKVQVYVWNLLFQGWGYTG